MERDVAWSSDLSTSTEWFLAIFSYSENTKTTMFVARAQRFKKVSDEKPKPPLNLSNKVKSENKPADWLARTFHHIRPSVNLHLMP